MRLLRQKLIHMIVKMPTGGSPLCLQGLVEVFRMCRMTTRDLNSFQRFSPTVNRFGRDYRMGQGLKFIGSVNFGDSRNFSADRNVNDTDSAKIPISPPPNPWFKFPSWARWVLGSVLSILLPFWNQKLQKLKRIEGEAELVVEGAGAVAEMVEKAAAATEKMSEGLAEKLPENSKLKETALVVEHISAVAAHDAHLIKDFLHKVDDLKEDFVDLETMVEPAVEKIVRGGEAKQREEADSTKSSTLN